MLETIFSKRHSTYYLIHDAIADAIITYGVSKEIFASIDNIIIPLLDRTTVFDYLTQLVSGAAYWPAK
jgi:hypothetical protein